MQINLNQNNRGFKIYHQYIGSGDGAIDKTVKAMKLIILKDSKHPLIRQFAYGIIGNAQNDLEKIEKIFKWTQNNIQYQKDYIVTDRIKQKAILYGDYFKDSFKVEFLTSPIFYINQIYKGEQPIGDCDDMTIFSLTLLKAIGIPVKMKIISTQPNLQYNHVYGVAYSNQYGWLPIDTIKKNHYVGFEPNGITRQFEVEV